MNEFDNVFLNLEDFPVEDYDGELLDGDDSIPPGKRTDNRVLTSTALTARIVPFKIYVKRGTTGKAPIAYKRTLSRAGYMRWETFTPIFGFKATQALKRYQSDRKLNVDGVIGPTTHKSLANIRSKNKPNEYAMDARAVWLLSQVKIITPLQEKVQRGVNAGLFGVNVRSSIHYTQGRLRMYGVRNKIKPPGIPRYEDCSSFATWIYYVAGLSDPNGLGYNGYGYTGTLANHGRRVSTSDLKPLDLIFYGNYPYKHVVIYLGSGKCVSHGNEYGPKIVTPYYRRDLSHARRYI